MTSGATSAAGRPNHYRCPYCGNKEYTKRAAIDHAHDCDQKHPGYVEVYTRYVDLTGTGGDKG